LAKSLPFCFDMRTEAFCSDVTVIGGPGYIKCQEWVSKILNYLYTH
jgi:hypothetical protein